MYFIGDTGIVWYEKVVPSLRLHFSGFKMAPVLTSLLVVHWTPYYLLIFPTKVRYIGLNTEKLCMKVCAK